ncbi:MAG TPA: glycosyltransferase family 39 protein, partial [Caulobacteraceae bacterium]
GLTTKHRGFLAPPAVFLALASLVLHGLANGQYGFHRDELYFIVCGDHPALGYVDQPPVVPLLAAWSHAIFGDNLLGFRFLPALTMTAAVSLTAEFTRLLGGGRFAQWLAGLCVLLAPFFLLEGVLFYTDMFQALTWLGIAWALLRLEQTGDERWWLAIGAIAGFSLETKYLIAFFLAGLVIGLLATPARRSLLRPWVWLGALLGGLIILPNLLWQQAHGWPFLEIGKAGAGGKNVALSPPAYLAQQVILAGPLASPVWIVGIVASFVRPKPAVTRAFPIAWLIMMIAFIAWHGKAYYLLPIYPILLALGATQIEGWIRAGAPRGVLLAAVGVSGAATMPLSLPILPVADFIRYQRMIGFTPSVGERNKTGPLPQYYADMFGWPQMAAEIAKVYDSLPPQDRARAVFFGENYGEAAAIDIFGRRFGLPPAISGHNNYFLWGPHGHDGSVMIIIGGDPAHYAALFRSVEVAGHIDNPLAMPYETDQPIYVLRGMNVPLQRYWPQVKSFQ